MTEILTAKVTNSTIAEKLISFLEEGAPRSFSADIPKAYSNKFSLLTR